MKNGQRHFGHSNIKDNTSHFCILADKVPDKVKEIFTNENIILISLEDFKQKI